MTLDEARVLKRIIREQIDIQGKCRMFSEALGKIKKCTCALCQIDDMDSENLCQLTNELVNEECMGK